LTKGWRLTGLYKASVTTASRRHTIGFRFSADAKRTAGLGSGTGLAFGDNEEI
jgi:hypothetical protein